MKTITHEGVEYVLKADIESAFKDRISKLSSRAIQAEEQAKALQEQMDNQSGELEKISKLQEKVSTLEQSLQDAESKYSRVSMLSEQGFTDPELREAVEWAYQRSKTEATLEDWIKGIKEKPEDAPLVLRPHLKAKQVPEVSTETAEASPMVTEAAPAPEAPTLLPPKTNTGAKPAPVQSGDILSRINDPEFYRANRAEIEKVWKAQRRTL